ncbi:MAG: T9SS type A sorting domain-containing protein [Bacteroidetes bacterium]|nr:T9SS type A sorting domain-containing protein [Bacteroidota bacterium]
MKKVLLGIFMCGALAGANAQMLPNGDFTTTSGTTHWNQGGGTAVIVTSVSLGTSGTLKGEDNSPFAAIQNTSTVGVFYTDKFAFTGRPAALRFIATYFPAKSGETLGMLVLFTKKNTTTNKIDTVGSWIGAAAPGTVNPWREFTLDLANYKLPDNPDTALVAFFATVNAGASQGTTLCIDNVKFSDFTQGVTEIDNYFYGKPSIQPNPVSTLGESKINYTLNGETNVKIAVYDLMGKKVLDLFDGRETNGEHSHSLSASALSTGTYIVKISTGSYEKTEKIVVQ